MVSSASGAPTEIDAPAYGCPTPGVMGFLSAFNASGFTHQCAPNGVFAGQTSNIPFASIAAGNLLTQDDQRRKLELVVDTARKVWG